MVAQATPLTMSISGVREWGEVMRTNETMA